MANLCRVRLTGPLAVHREGLWEDLLARGYSPLTSRNLMRLFAHLSRWLAGKGLEAKELKQERVKEFFAHRRKSGYTAPHSLRGLEPVLHYLLATGIVQMPEECVVEQTPLDHLLREYEDYLVQERSLVVTTVEVHLRVARRFLLRRFGSDTSDLAHLTTADITSFILDDFRRRSIGSAKNTVTALRSLLRYLHVQGNLDTDLASAVPAVAGRRGASLPKSLAQAKVRQLLRTCDRRTHIGRRNYSILLLLVRLGLRAHEVASLKLDDVYWDRGEIVIQGKGNREDRLPLPHDVGEAMASYLSRSRFRTDSRNFFLQARAPFEDLGRCTVSAMVKKAGARIGLPSLSAHKLRHTAATAMLRHGSSLNEIAQVLRHRSVNTTAIYAKVDRDALRSLCLPWPGGEES